MEQLETRGVLLNLAVMTPREPAPGRPVVACVHGLGRDSMASFYWTVAAPLTNQGYTVVLHDLRGHGGSFRPRMGYRLDDFSEDLADLLDYAEERYGATGSLTLVGNSYGGAIATHYANIHPDRVAGVALIEAGPPTKSWSVAIRIAIEEAFREIQRPELVGELTEQFGPALAAKAMLVVNDLAATTFRAEAPTGTLMSDSEVRSFPHPVLALFGGSSSVSAIAPTLSEMLPDCRTEVVPGYGHTLLVDAAEDVRALLLPWIRERTAAHSGI